jgi:tRNA threonylcarbamoyl adenosine modification protein YeaZ
VILLLDSSLPGITLGLAEEASGRVVDHLYLADQRTAARGLSQEVELLLGRNGVSRSQLSHIFVGEGPGSFTGLRIGIAWALGFSAGMPVIPIGGISALEALALWLAQEKRHKVAVFLENKGNTGYVSLAEGDHVTTQAWEVGPLDPTWASVDLYQVETWQALQADSGEYNVISLTGEALTMLLLQAMARYSPGKTHRPPEARYFRKSTAEENLALSKKKE